MAIHSSCRSVILVALLWSAITVGATLKIPNSARSPQPPSILSVANKTTTRSLINFPAGFEVRVSYGDHHFRFMDMLRNGVAALHPLALRDAEARTLGVHYYFRRVGDMVIDAQPTLPATDIANKVALLCIYFGLKASLTDQRYANARYDCIVDDVEVAHVLLKPAGYRLSLHATNSSAPIERRLSRNDNISAKDQQIANTSLKASTSTFDFRPNGQALGIVAVFLTAMTAIMHWGLRPNTDRLPPYTAISPGRDWDTRLIFVEPTPPRVHPPYFESRWAIDMARQLPFFCVQSHTFAELDSIITVDGVDVGAALLLKEPPDKFGRRRDGKVVET